MRNLCIVVPVIVILASPAFAQSTRKAKTQRSPPTMSHDASAGRKGFGTDPDPNVRFEMMRQYNWRKGGS
jgi:hypothetical protein